MSKVTLPKEVAEAVERERNSGFSEQQILTFPWADYLESSDRDVIQIYRRDNFDDLVRALYDGYEVEKSPEDKLREYIESNRTWIDRPEDYVISERQRYVGRNQGVMMTLSILGITIEGIND